MLKKLHFSCKEASLINSCLVDLIDVTLACENANTKFLNVVSIAVVDAEECVDDSLIKILRLRFCLNFAQDSTGCFFNWCPLKITIFFGK